VRPNLGSCTTSCHRSTTITLIGDTSTTTSVATATTVDPVTTATVVASASTTAPTSDPVPLLHPNPVPYVVDTGASLPISPFKSDFIQAPFGLIRSATSVAYSSKASSKAYSNDPYTLITGEDVSVDPVDLSSTDTDSVDTFEFASTLTKDHFDIWEFGTATLVFISIRN